MNIESNENATIYKKEEIIEDFFNNSKNENNEKNIADKESPIYPSKFQLDLKIDLNYLVGNDFLNSLTDLRIIHELSNENLAILLGGKLVIISPKSFKEIKIIEPDHNERCTKKNSIGNDFIDFIELSNSDILIWTSNVILIYDKEYNLKEKIDEIGQGNMSIRIDYDYGTATYYDINSIHELKNGKLVSCNSYGLKFYDKYNDKYNLIWTERMDVDVHFIIELKPN